jgi:flagellar M-ring protein FliF
MGEGFNEDELKYDVLLEKIRGMVEESPEAVALVLQALMTEEADISIR